MNAELYINCFLIDLEPGTSNIGVTFQVNDIAELKDRKANTTNQFKIPKTANNRQALGFIDQVNSMSRLPYRKLPAKYVDDGVEIITNGVAIIEEAGNYFNVQVLSGNYDFFAELENKNLKDLDLSDLDHDWNLTNIYASRAFTEADGYCYPIIDYTGSTYFMNFSVPGNVMLEKIFPAVFVNKILKAIGTDSGYSVGGSFIEHNVGKSLIIPFSRAFLSHSQLWINNRIAKAKTTVAINVAPSTTQLIQLDTEITDVSSFGVDVAAQGYQYFPTGGNNEMDVDVRVEFILSPTALPSYYVLAFERYNPTTLTWSFIGGFNGFFTNVTNLVLDSRDFQSKLPIAHLFPGYGLRAKMTINTGSDTMVILPGSTIEFIPREKTYFANSIQLGPCLPDMSQTDFIKSICNQFCLIPVTDDVTRETKFNLFSDVYKNKGIARDWSSKIDMSQSPQISFRYGRLGQKNNLKYTEDDAVTEGLGDGSFTIDDEVPDKEVEIDTLPFAATEMKRIIEPYYIPEIKTFNVTGVDGFGIPIGDEVTVKPRILLHHVFEDLDGVISYQDPFLGSIVPFTVPMAWFIHPTDALPARPIPNNLGFDNTIIDDFYDGIKTMTDRFKKVTAYFKLNAVDVQNFDHMIPVYIDHLNEYFFVNKISNYKPNQLTQVELYRL